MLFRRESTGSGTPVWVLSDPPSWDVPGEDRLSAAAQRPVADGHQPGGVGRRAVEQPQRGGRLGRKQRNRHLAARRSRLAGNPPPGVHCLRAQAAGSVVLPAVRLPGSAGSLGAPLPQEYRSFAWPGAGDGTRIIAGLEDGALLRLQGGANFEYVVGGGGNASIEAAFASPEEGWLQRHRLAEGAEQRAAGARSARAPPRRPPPSRCTPGRCRSAVRCWRSPPSRGRPRAIRTRRRWRSATWARSRAICRAQGWTPEFLYNADGEVAAPPPARRGVARTRPRLRGRRRRRNVAVAQRNRSVGARPREAAGLPRQPDRDRLLPERTRGRLRGRQAGGAARLRQDLDPADAAAGPGSRRTSPRSRSRAARRSPPTAW